MKKKSVFHNGRQYFRAAVAEGNTFYCCYSEGDDNANVVVYGPDGKLLSDNYFASNYLMEVVDDDRCTWMSRTFKKISKSIKE